MEQDRKMIPRKEKNEKGELVWDIHPAKLLLRQDVADGLHLQMSPAELQQTKTEYGLFHPRKFKERIYQEVRRNKVIYYLNLKRMGENKYKDILLGRNPTEGNDNRMEE